jgi:hypothetical protein
MNSMTIVLIIENEEKRFVSPSFIPGKFFRKASEIADNFEGRDEDGKINLDNQMQFVCDVFGNQFDINQFENGIDSRKLLKTVYATVNYVIGNIEQASMLLSNGEGNQDQKN